MRGSKARAVISTAAMVTTRSRVRSSSAERMRASAYGGGAPPPYADARIRFAELLRTRDRVVTIDDVESTARAFEPRIKRVNVTTASELGPHGVRQVDVVDVGVTLGDFA